MNDKLLTKQHLEFLSLKVGYTDSYEYTLFQNATLLKMTCHGSDVLILFVTMALDCKLHMIGLAVLLFFSSCHS